MTSTADRFCPRPTLGDLLARRQRERYRRAVARAETCALPFRVDDTDLAEGTFQGLATVYGVPIETAPLRTLLQRGAFDESLRTARHRIRILWQHDRSEPIGLPDSIRATEAGLEVVGRISKTARGMDALTLLRDGVVSELSIGFDALESRTVKREGETFRLVTKAKLWEVSLVTWGENPRAKVLDVNALDRRLEAAAASVAASLGEGDAMRARMTWWRVCDAVPRAAEEAAELGLRRARSQLGEVAAELHWIEAPSWSDGEALRLLPAPAEVAAGTVHGAWGRVFVALPSGILGVTVRASSPVRIYLHATTGRLGNVETTSIAATAAHELFHASRTGGGSDEEAAARTFEEASLRDFAPTHAELREREERGRRWGGPQILGGAFGS